MRWIASFGGPLILLPSEAIHRWTGAYGPGGEEDWDEEETEYWRVCEEVPDYAEAVPVDGTQALVLANGRARTTFVESHRLFVQRLVAGELAEAVAVALGQLTTLTWDHHTEWTSAGPGYLFDATRPGRDVRPEDRLDIDIEPGHYAVRSAYLALGPDDGLDLALTHLTRIA